MNNELVQINKNLGVVTDENGSAYVYLVRNVLNKYTKSGYYSYSLFRKYRV